MTAREYKTKKGATQYQPALTAAEMQHIMFSGDGTGFCVACGEEADGCEPDARQYECDSCGAKKVYGMEELLVMGLLIITDDEPKTEVAA